MSFCVIKRNGTKEEVSFDKVIRRIKKLCYELSDVVQATLIAQKVCSQITNLITTKELDELAAQIAISMETIHLDYGVLASRIIISNNHKCTSSSFSETISILYSNKKGPLIADDVYTVIMENKEKLNSVIDYSRDYLFDYFAFKTLENAYLLKINDGLVVERIQHLFMRVSVGIHKNDLKSAIDSYHYMSQKYFIHATPTLYNAGTPKSAFSSCFLLNMADSVDGIYKTIGDCAKISSVAGGIGLSISKIRCKNSYIRGTNGKANGIIPLCRVLNETSRHINQSGKRPGSIAVYIEPHNAEIMEFLKLKHNTGAESERARDLFLALWISDLFMKRVSENANWSLFDSNECEGLDELFGDEFETAYLSYERGGRAHSVLPARTVWNAILKSQIETGVPYISFKDHVNRKNNQANLGTIKNSNLCNEIVQYSSSEEYAVCTLASLSLPAFLTEDGATFDFEKLKEVTGVVVRNLNRIIDINYYPLPETKRSNMRHRPMGIGVQGLADVFARMGFAFDSDEARALNRRIFETMYFGALTMSHTLALQQGAYSTFQGSPLSKGQFQFDLWGVKPTLDWESLRADIMRDGVANSLLIALMPTASTSQILGNNECFEPITSNIYTRRTIAGDFIVINKYLVKDLMKLGLWSPQLKDAIIANDGSVQNIQEIPGAIKNLYKTVWEIKQKVIIDYAIERGPFICQTQSMNLFFSQPDQTNLSSALFYGWKGGLKTGCYYIRSKPRATAQKFTIEPEVACESCSA